MVKIYHNPRCSTSRNVLDALRERGLQPEVIEYLQTPPRRELLITLIHDAGLTVREALRSREPIYQELGLGDSRLTDDQLLDAMVQHPILMNRPFLVTDKGTRLCRPIMAMDEIL